MSKVAQQLNLLQSWATHQERRVEAPPGLEGQIKATDGFLRSQNGDVPLLRTQNGDVPRMGVA